MSYTWDELKGLYAMMPAFSNADARDIRAKNTIDVDNLHDGVDRIIKDGVGCIATTSGSGEGWNLLWDEFKIIVRETLDAVNNRVPVFFGVTSPNPREVVEKMDFVREAGGEGVMLGLPYYHALSVANVIAFYKAIAETFPDLAISIYHNPLEHRVHIPVSAYPELVKNPSIMSTKDSHRSPLEFERLMEITYGKIAHFVNYTQLYPYFQMGASGCWAFDCFMGPWPILRAYEAAVDGDTETVRRIVREMTGGRASDGSPRLSGEGGSGRTAQGTAGYINPGPARVPHFHPHEEDARAQKKAADWLVLCERYRPEVEDWRRAHAEL